MYYKVIKDSKVIDVLSVLIYVKYSLTLKRIILANIDNAQGILSSDEKQVWHLRGLYDIPVEGYDTVEIAEITKEEYHQWKALNGRTPEEIIDEYTLSLIEGGLL